MAFELYNFNCHAVECTILPFGILRVPPGAYVPTPEQESKGITADALKDFQPSFLRAVAPLERGRLLEKFRPVVEHRGYKPDGLNRFAVAMEIESGERRRPRRPQDRKHTFVGRAAARR